MLPWSDSSFHRLLAQLKPPIADAKPIDGFYLSFSFLDLTLKPPSQCRRDHDKNWFVSITPGFHHISDLSFPTTNLLDYNPRFSRWLPLISAHFWLHFFIWSLRSPWLQQCQPTLPSISWRSDHSLGPLPPPILVEAPSTLLNSNSKIRPFFIIGSSPNILSKSWMSWIITLILINMSELFYVIIGLCCLRCSLLPSSSDSHFIPNRSCSTLLSRYCLDSGRPY